jgi:hypothetical protein
VNEENIQTITAKTRKLLQEKTVARRVKRVERIPKKTESPDEILFRLKDTTSTFGGTHDTGTAADKEACALPIS